MKLSGAKYRISFGNDNPGQILFKYEKQECGAQQVEILATASPFHIHPYSQREYLQMVPL